MAGDVSRQWERQQRQLQQIDNDIAKAQGFEWARSNASSGREKALIHQECESFFENSKPGMVLSGLNAKRRKLERDIEKIQERLRDITRLMETTSKRSSSMATTCATCLRRTARAPSSGLAH
ncbi:hypothetical protein NWF32_29370 [Pseudomonas qingdaonensis]|nr:hypothetical protein [Pseudomonas qingdaonensis]